VAAGNELLSFRADEYQPGVASPATYDRRNDHGVLDFDAATDENAVFGGVLPTHYAGNGLTVTLVWSATTATTGDVVWNVAIEAHPDDAFDLDADGFAAANAATATAPSASGEVQYTDITFTDGADMDSLAAGESFRLKVTRDANHASDTMAGDAELHKVIVKET